MRTKAPLVFGFPESEQIAFLESRIGPLDELGAVFAFPTRRPRLPLDEAKAALGLFAYQHPSTTYPWRRERAARQATRLLERIERRGLWCSARRRAPR
jgi:hypothetical protein